MRQSSEIEDLIKAAFQQARDSGKLEWSRMTVAVLKNRLLELTNRDFSESDYQAASFTQFLSKFPQLLAIDRSTFPPTVELIENGVGTAAGPIAEWPRKFGRIRGDLWRAILDYTSETQYLWDSELGIARPGETGEEGLVIPTVTPEITARWRLEFVDTVKLEEKNNQELIRVLDWQGQNLGTKVLPQKYQAKWNGVLKDRVLEILREFFADHELPEPRDVIQAMPPRTTGRVYDPQVQELRAFVISCVAEMTAEEILGLKLPSMALFKMMTGRRYG